MKDNFFWQVFQIWISNKTQIPVHLITSIQKWIYIFPLPSWCRFWSWKTQSIPINTNTLISPRFSWVFVIALMKCTWHMLIVLRPLWTTFCMDETLFFQCFGFTYCRLHNVWIRCWHITDMLSWLWHMFTTPFRWFIASLNNESALNACLGTFTPFWCHLYRPSKHVIFLFFLLRCQLVIISCTAFLWFITLHLWCRLVIIFSTAIHWFIACRLRCSLVIFFSATLLWFIAFQLWCRLVIIFFKAFLWCIAFELWCRFDMIFSAAFLWFSAFLLWCRFVMILYIAFLWCIVFHLWCRLIMIFSTAFLWCISFQLWWRFRTYIFCCYNLHMPFYFSLPVLSLKLLPRLLLCFWHLLSLLLSSMNRFLQFSRFLFAERLVSIHSKSEREQKPHYILFCLYQLVLNFEIKYTRNIKLLKILTPLQDRDRNRSV